MSAEPLPHWLANWGGSAAKLAAALELLVERGVALDAANSASGQRSGDAAIARGSVILQAREVVSRYKHPEPSA